LLSGWFVVTDRPLIISCPYFREGTARAVGNGHAAQLRRGMRATGDSETRIAELVGALRVAYGTRVGPEACR
jgi:hypothetical protein